MVTSSSSKSARSSRLLDPPARICVIGVGGGGCNAIVRMMKAKRVPGVRYLGVNTDIKSLERLRDAQVLQIGEGLTHGMGAGGNPEIGAQAAEQDKKILKKSISGADLVFLAAGMGGGTGTGAAPIVADIAREAGALVVAVVSTPFSFEGARRAEAAELGLTSLRDQVDNIVVIHNDRLLQLLDEDVSMTDALRRADDAVMFGVLSVAELVNLPGEINVDLADVKSIMRLPGRALMAIGQAEGLGSALQAAQQAVRNPLLDLAIDGAQGVLFNVSGGPSLKLSEVNEAGEYISSLVDPNAIIFFGMVNDHALKTRTRVTLIATGISNGKSPAGSLEANFKGLLSSADFGRHKPDLDLPPFLRLRSSFRPKP